MRAAPPVEFAAVPGWAPVPLRAALLASALGVTAYWLGALWLDVGVGGAGIAALAGAGALARVARRAGAAGLLRWTGAGWVWRAAARAPALDGLAQVALDLGPWLVVRFRPAAGARRRPIWLHLGLRSDPAAWTSLRGALFRSGRGVGRPA